MIETGIPGLDEHLNGGIPEGKSLLFYIQPGVEGGKLGMQIIHHNLAKGKCGVYVVSSSSPRVVRESFRELGWDMDEFGDRFSIIDGYSSLIGAPSEEKYVVMDPHDIGSYEEAMDEQLNDVGFSNPIIVVDSLSTLIDMCGAKEVIRSISRWNESLQDHEAVSIYNFIAWPYSEAILNKIRKTFDAVVDISGITERVIMGQRYCLSKVGWGGKTGGSVLFKVLKPGGARAYIPKVLVIGPFNAGKSTFVRALSTRSVSVDRVGTTVALDHGFVDHAGFAVDIFGTPGQERFDPLLKHMGGEAIGIFMIVDSTKPEQFGRAKQMMEKAMGVGLPYVVVANKRDLEGALNGEEIRKRMKIPSEIPIIPTVATERKGVFDAFEKLIEKIMEEEVVKI